MKYPSTVLLLAFLLISTSCTYGKGNNNGGGDRPPNLKVKYFILLEPAATGPDQLQNFQVILENTGESTASSFGYWLTVTRYIPDGAGSTAVPQGGFGNPVAGPLAPGHEMVVEGAVLLGNTGFIGIEANVDNLDVIQEEDESDNRQELLIATPISN